MPRFFLSNVRIIPDPGAKTVLRERERVMKKKKSVDWKKIPK